MALWFLEDPNHHRRQHTKQRYEIRQLQLENQLSEGDFKATFRLSRDNFELLLQELGPHLSTVCSWHCGMGDSDPINFDAKTKSTITDEELTELAVKEILQETKIASIRARQLGPSGWQSKNHNINKKFLNNTVLANSQFNSRKNSSLKDQLGNLTLRSMSSDRTAGSAKNLKFETLLVTNPKPFVYHVELNRPNKRNAMIHNMWLELKSCFDAISEDSNCRSVLLSGAGPLFCAGIDLQNFMTISQQMAEFDDVARKCKIMLKYIRQYQDSLSSIEKCSKPVISAVHNACIGAAVHMICASDIRYCTSDAWFQIREVDLGIAADVGALQRLPKIIGSASLTRELILTGRKFDSTEADKCGFVNRVFESKDKMIEEAMKMAVTIACKSPIAVQTAKRSILYSQDHTIAEGLEHIALLNQTMLQSEDLMIALMAIVNKDSEPPVFSKL